MSDRRRSVRPASIEEQFEQNVAEPFRNGADHIVIDGSRSKFQAEATQHCLRCGWLTQPELAETPDSQGREYRIRLTDAGREHWQIPKK